MRLHIVHVASEVAPYSKTGGLGDVLGALPSALARRGHEVTVVTPRYGSIDPERFGLARWLSRVPVAMGTETVEVGVFEGRPPGGGRARLLFVDEPSLFDRPGLYGPVGGADYPDNARRFTLLGRAALALAGLKTRAPDLVHGHDWQAGPAILEARGRAKTVFTIHNLAFKGLFAEATLAEVGLPAELFHPEALEFYGQVSLLKAGLVFADRLTTVSPTYAREIQTALQGSGLDGLLRARAERLTGILNGVDQNVWDPERDPLLPARYSASDLSAKRRCKAELQREFGLPERPDAPLSGSISRLTEQKGFDLIAAALPQLLESEMQYVALGTGEPELERALVALSRQFPKKVAVKIAYDERLAHRIEAGSDLFVMPSKYEPCGLNQMYSLRYGTPPIVRATGGLDDSVVDCEARSRTGTGFKFEPYTAQALLETWRRAMALYRESPADFQGLMKRGMAQDFSWDAAAERYLDVYERALSASDAPGASPA